jgi:hypothetical protein
MLGKSCRCSLALSKVQASKVTRLQAAAQLGKKMWKNLNTSTISHDSPDLAGSISILYCLYKPTHCHGFPLRQEEVIFKEFSPFLPQRPPSGGL